MCDLPKLFVKGLIMQFSHMKRVVSHATSGGLQQIVINLELRRKETRGGSEDV